MNEDFKALCERSEKKIAEWMYNDLAKKYYFEIDIHCDGDYAFRHSCENGHFEIAKWLYSLRGVNIPCFGDYAFRAGCENGHLEIAKWLYSHGGVDIHSNYNYEFRFSCYNGHKHVSKWLYSLVSSTFICDKYTFEWIHSECKKDIVEWFNDIQVQVLSLLKTLLIQAIINPCPQSSL